jgi:hypothetical protein
MDVDLVIEDLEIRDQNNHESAMSNMGEFNAETIMVNNQLDQVVTFQLQGTIAGTGVWCNVGSTFNIGATTKDYVTVTDFFPCYKMVASCDTAAPTTGNLNVWIIKSK